MEKRQELCKLEVTLNQRFTPELYVGVASFDGTDEVAVQMLRFDSAHEADKLLANGQLTAQHLSAFAESLWDSYATFARLPLDTDRMHRDQRDNVRDLRSCNSCDQAQLDRIEQWIDAEFTKLAPVWGSRFAIDGHGDLHLTNLVLRNGAIRAFDCLEFSKALRVVDPICDVAFLVMVSYLAA